MSVTSQTIVHSLRLHHLYARPDAVSALESVLRAEEDPKRALTRLCASLREKATTSNIVDCALVSALVADLSKNDDDIEEERIVLVDAFRQSETLIGSAAQKIGYLRDRYTQVHQRLLRHEPYTPTQHRGKQELTRVDAILAGGAKPGVPTHVLGYVTRLDAERLVIEDLSGRLALSLDQLEATDSLVSEGCLVIAVGYVLEEEEGVVLVASQLASPLAETRLDTEKLRPGLGRTRFGLPLLSREDALVMQGMEEEANDCFFVILSDVHLDEQHCVDNLRKLFQGFAACPPTLLVLLGNFCSRPFANRSGADADNQCTREEYGRLMERLGDVIANFPTFHDRTRFVIVPGVNDPCATGSVCFPKPGLPRLFADRVLNKVPASCKIDFASNPCRVLFHLQEICIFRDDLLQKMLKHCVAKPLDKETPELFVKSVIDQAHLLPLPSLSSPVFFANADALALNPLPHICVLASGLNEQFNLGYSDCGFLNPGSFSFDSSFVVYRPAAMATEFSRVAGA